MATGWPTRGDLDSVTRGGIAAVRAARARARAPQGYDLDVWDQWLQRHTGGGQPTTPGYSYGSPGPLEDARYAGFETGGERDAYVRGRGRQLQDEAQGWAVDTWDQLIGSYDPDTGLPLHESEQVALDRDYQGEMARAKLEASKAFMPKVRDVPAVVNVLRSTYRGSPEGWEKILDQPVHPDQMGWMPQQADPYYVPARTGPEDQGRYGGGVGVVNRFLPRSWSSGVEPMTVNKDWSPTPERYDPALGKKLWDAGYKNPAVAEFKDYAADLDAWRADEQARIDAFAEMAGDYMDTPLHEWMQGAAIDELGFDPAMAEGLYGPEESVSDWRANLDLAGFPIDEFRQARDLDALDAGYGSYDEMVSEQRRAEDEQRRIDTEAMTADQEAAQAATYGFIRDKTGIDPDALMDATDTDPVGLTNTLNSQEFDDALALLESYIVDPETGQPGIADPDQLQEFAQFYALSDPTTLAILSAMYPGVLPDFDRFYPGG